MSWYFTGVMKNLSYFPIFHTVLKNFGYIKNAYTSYNALTPEQRFGNIMEGGKENTEFVYSVSQPSRIDRI